MPETPQNPLPPVATMELVAQRLGDLRDALVIASQALRDYQFSLESPERHSAAQEAQHVLERSCSSDGTTQ